MNPKDLQQVLDAHRKWIFGEAGGSRAYLRSADLRSADLSGADLSGADLRSADLRSADLSGAYLSGADLSGAYLSGANLSGADLRSADLRSAENSDLVVARTRILPEGDIIGWKKCNDEVIVKLLIPAKAKRSHAFGRKCRAEYAKVIEAWSDGKKVKSAETSTHGPKTKYVVGKIIRPDKWDEDWSNECSHGVHFYITQIEAENHN